MLKIIRTLKNLKATALFTAVVLFGAVPAYFSTDCRRPCCARETVNVAGHQCCRNKQEVIKQVSSAPCKCEIGLPQAVFSNKESTIQKDNTVKYLNNTSFSVLKKYSSLYSSQNKSSSQTVQYKLIYLANCSLLI